MASLTVGCTLEITDDDARALVALVDAVAAEIAPCGKPACDCHLTPSHSVLAAALAAIRKPVTEPTTPAAHEVP